MFLREFCEWHKGLTSQKHCITHFELNKSLWISYRLKYLLYTSRNIDIWSFLVCKNIGDFTRWIDIDNHLILASTVELTSYNVFDRFFLCRFSFTFIRPFFFLWSFRVFLLLVWRAMLFFTSIFRLSPRFVVIVSSLIVIPIARVLVQISDLYVIASMCTALSHHIYMKTDDAIESMRHTKWHTIRYSWRYISAKLRNGFHFGAWQYWPK